MISPIRAKVLLIDIEESDCVRATFIPLLMLSTYLATGLSSLVYHQISQSYPLG
jgi:hypothetical protein